MTVFIPLTIRKRNGRPKIMPPAAASPSNDDDRPEPHVLRAVARAWGWRRRLEAGEVSTIFEIAQAEGVTDRFVSHRIRLAYLAPRVLEMLVVRRRSPAVSLKDLVAAADLPWKDQAAMIFDR